MAKKLDPALAEELVTDARRLEREAMESAESTEPYPPETQTSRPNLPKRVFNLRLTDEQLTELQRIADEKHLPVSTMARAWLLDRLDQERHAS